MACLRSLRFPRYEGLDEFERASFAYLPYLMSALKKELERQEVPKCKVTNHFKKRVRERTRMSLEEVLHLLNTQSRAGVARFDAITTSRVIFSNKDNMLYYVIIRTLEEAPTLVTIVPAYKIFRDCDDHGEISVRLRTSHFRLPKTNSDERRIKKAALKMDNLLKPLPADKFKQEKLSTKESRVCHITLGHIIAAFHRLERPFPPDLAEAMVTLLVRQGKSEEEIIDLLYAKPRYRHDFSVLLNDGQRIAFYAYTPPDEPALHFPEPLLKDYIRMWVEHAAHRRPDEIVSAHVKVTECVPNDSGWVDRLDEPKRELALDFVGTEVTERIA